MIGIAIVLLLNLAFLAWVVRLFVKDPANVWKRGERSNAEPPVAPPPAPAPDELP